MTTEEMIGLASLAKKKAAIMAELKKFGKDSYNQNQKYKFPSAASIFDAIRKLMAEHGLVLFTSAIDGHQNEMESKSGNAGLHTTVKYRMLWIDTETGAMVEDLWLSESDDWQDKGYSKSATLALKSYLLTSFIVSSGDETDDPDSGIGSQDAAKRNATSPKQGKPARQGAATSNGAQNGSQSEIPADKATDHVLLRSLEIVDKDGQKRLKFKSDDGRTVLAFTRQLFKERGWIDEAEWTGLGDYPIKDGIPVGITFHRINDDGGHWEVTAVSEVVF